MEQRARPASKGGMDSTIYGGGSLNEASNETPNTERIRLKPPENDTDTDSNEKKSGNSSEYSLERTSTAPSDRLPMRKRFSTYLITATLTSIILLLANIAFLTFLWNSSNSNQRKIVLANWITRSVTLSTLALRITISVQAGIATSMLASLAIEGSGIRLIDVLEVSIMRFSNTGPHTLFWIYAKQAKSFAIILLLTVLALSTLAIQLSSTLLLSDIALISTLAPALNSRIQYGFNSTGFGGYESNLYQGIWGSKYWTQLTTDYPSFGEYSIPVEQKDELDDTGTVIRSMIPIADKDTRERLRTYKGPAFAFDARTVCTQPKFLSMKRCRDDQPQRICGKVAPRHTTDNAVFNINGTSYDCALPYGASRADILEPIWTVCRLESRAAGGLISALDPTNNGSLRHSWYIIDTKQGRLVDPESGVWTASDGNISWPVDLGNAYLVLNFTSELLFVWDGSTNATYIGPWAEFETPTYPSHTVDKPNSVRASLCYDALYGFPLFHDAELTQEIRPENVWSIHFQDFNVTLSSSNLRREPVTSFKAKASGFNTTEVRRQLGVGPVHATLEERGILSLFGEELLKAMAERQSEWVPPDPVVAQMNGALFDDKRDGQWFYMPTFSWIVSAIIYNMDPSAGVHLCLHCIPYNSSFVVSAVHSSIFNDALIDTGSPALALQAFLTTILRTAYYSWLPLFDTTANTTTVSYVDRLAPVSRRGYWAVMGIISTHIVVCGTITSLFLSRTRFSLLGNIWATVAQVVHAEPAQLILQDATMRTDKEVAQVLRHNNGLKKIYRIFSRGKGDGPTLAPKSKLDSENSSGATNPHSHLIRRKSPMALQLGSDVSSEQVG